MAPAIHLSIVGTALHEVRLVAVAVRLVRAQVPAHVQLLRETTVPLNGAPLVVIS